MEKNLWKRCSKKIYLNKKPWKYKIIVIVTILLLALSAFLIWAFGFKGLLYLEYKEKTKDYYEQLVVKDESIENCNNLVDAQAKKSCLNLYNDKMDYYLWQQTHSESIIKYNDFFEVESLKSNTNIIFSVTNKYFFDIREEIESEEKLLTSIFFVYYPKDSDYLLHDILYKESHLDKLGEYSK